MRTAIIGAGPAGANLAYLLSQAGGETLLFDAREAWEKPCGGGVTAKALHEFDFLRADESAKQMIDSVRLISGQGREVTVSPRRHFAIYARAELSRLMRRRAVEAGAQLVCERVERTDFAAGKWRIATARQSFTADFLVGADGANSIIRRRVGLRFEPRDFAYALGWRVKPSADSTAQPACVDIKFLSAAGGYVWMFPRTDHLSYGIAAQYRERTPAQLKALLLEFIAAQDSSLAAEITGAPHHSTPRAEFYGAMIPALDTASWDRLSVGNAAQAWALIGDAAGFVDPITGEGIYYALKSAALLARALLTRVEHYDELWRAEFGADLRRAAELSDRFYHGSFAGAPLLERMMQFARRHRGVRDVLCDLIAGEQGYVGLKRRLLRSAAAIV